MASHKEFTRAHMRLEYLFSIVSQSNKQSVHSIKVVLALFAVLFLMSIPIPSLAQADSVHFGWFNLPESTKTSRPHVPIEPITQVRKDNSCISGSWDKKLETKNNTPTSLLQISKAHEFASGEHQIVAVIDSGMDNPHIKNVDSGIDFVTHSAGKEDCDGTGTLIGGILTADNIESLVPHAHIIPIRWTSHMYSAKGQSATNKIQKLNDAIMTLAGAIVYAADRHASVIVVSQYMCVPSYMFPAIGVLNQAISYATEVKNSVIVSASGDTSASGVSGTACNQNTRFAMNTSWSKDPIGRGSHGPQPPEALDTISLPSWHPQVLSVAAVDKTGNMSGYNIGGPWVSIAAPGNVALGLGNKDARRINSFSNGKGGFLPIESSSYAAAYVAGVAALVREKFPHASYKEIIHRLEYTADSNSIRPDSRIGYGVVNPIGALTWNIPRHPREDRQDTRRAVSLDQPLHDPYLLAKIVATSIFGTAIAGLGLFLIIRWIRGIHSNGSA